MMLEMRALGREEAVSSRTAGQHIYSPALAVESSAR